jgi:hypothetical protein
MKVSKIFLNQDKSGSRLKVVGKYKAKKNSSIS